jgi:hypothetical protein
MCKRKRQRSEFKPYDLNRKSIRDKNRRVSHGDNVRGSVVPLERYWVELRRLQYKLRQLRRRLERGIRHVDYVMAAKKHRSLFRPGGSVLSASSEPYKQGLHGVVPGFKDRVDAYKRPFLTAVPIRSPAPVLFCQTQVTASGEVWKKLWDGPWVNVTPDQSPDRVVDHGETSTAWDGYSWTSVSGRPVLTLCSKEHAKAFVAGKVSVIPGSDGDRLIKEAERKRRRDAYLGQISAKETLIARQERVVRDCRRRGCTHPRCRWSCSLCGELQRSMVLIESAKKDIAKIRQRI